MFNKLHAFFNPEQYHGWGKRRNYFEGWYCKVITADEQHAFAFIPGIAMDTTGNKHAFIQVLDGKRKTAAYHRFDTNAFKPTPRKFEIDVAGNFFSAESIRLDLPGVIGQLHFSGNVGWPKPWYSPGIMGPFSFVPFMECYHGIVSMDHRISGNLSIHGKNIDFTNGRGYMEKDWGHSFPSAYFWMQSNHFSTSGISLKCSVAKIPWLRSSFVGFIAGVWLGNRLIRFTTYNSTKLKRSFADEHKVEIILENKNYLLEISAHRDTSTQLASPIRGFMEGRIEESMTAVLEVTLTDRKNKTILLQDKGRNAGLEVAGEIEQIMIS